MTNFFDIVLGLLHQDDRFFATDGTLLRNEVFAAAMSMDKKLIHLLLSNDDTRKRFFTKVDGDVLPPLARLQGQNSTAASCYIS